MPDPCVVRLDRAADHRATFAANFATTDLTAQVGYPNHAAQLVIFFNNGSSAEDAVYTDHRGRAHTEPVPAGGYAIVRTPVASINTSSGTNVSARVYWWCAPGFELVPAP